MTTVLDWSNYQGVPDLGALLAVHPEVKGVVLKAGEGASGNTNPYFDAQLNQVRMHSLPWGAYQYFHPADFGTTDAQTVLHRVAGLAPPLGIALDTEVSDGDNPYDILAKMISDLEMIRASYPFRTWVYSAAWFLDPNTLGAEKYLLSQLAALWVAAYQPTLPVLPEPWTQALMWQFTDSFTGPHQMDASYFLGTPEQWGFLSSGGVPPVSSEVAKIRATQGIVHAKVDGIFGPDTHSRVMAIADMAVGANHNNASLVKYVQQVIGGVTVDGIYGPATHDRVGVTIKALQLAWGVVPVDSTWNGQTNFAEAVLDPLR